MRRARAGRGRILLRTSPIQSPQYPSPEWEVQVDRFKLLHSPCRRLVIVLFHPSHLATSDGTSHAPGSSRLRLPTKKEQKQRRDAANPVQRGDRVREELTATMAGQDEKPAATSGTPATPSQTTQPGAPNKAAPTPTAQASTAAPGVRPARPYAAPTAGTAARPPGPNVRPPQPRPMAQARPLAPGITPRPGGTMPLRPGTARPVQPHAQGRPPNGAPRPQMPQARPGPLQGPNGPGGRPLQISTAQQGVRPSGIRPGQASMPGSAPSSAPGSAPNSAPGTPRSSVGSNASGGPTTGGAQGQGAQPPMRRPPGSIAVRPQSGQMTPSLGGGFAVGGGLATPTTQGECEAWASRLRDTSIGEWCACFPDEKANSSFRPIEENTLW